MMAGDAGLVHLQYTARICLGVWTPVGQAPPGYLYVTTRGVSVPLTYRTQMSEAVKPTYC